MAVHVYEAAMTPEVSGLLMEMSRIWESEDSCYGYRANTEEDLAGRRVFLAEEDGICTGYLLGRTEEAKQTNSIMTEGTKYFEAEELYVLPAFRNRGTGKALFRYAEESVRAEAEFIMVSTASKNMRGALHLYAEELGMGIWCARLFKKMSGQPRKD